MQLITTSAPLLVQVRLLQELANAGQIDPEELAQAIDDYLAEHGTVPSDPSVGFVYDRNSIVAATWIIDHGLNKYPQVTLIGTDNFEMDADISYSSLNRVTVTFAEPQAGKAVLI